MTVIQSRLTKRHIAILLFMMAACLVGRNFVANATFASVKAKPRACAISHSQIDICKEIGKKQGVAQHVDAAVPMLYLLPPVVSAFFQAAIAPSACNIKEISAVSPSRAPPFLS